MSGLIASVLRFVCGRGGENQGLVERIAQSQCGLNVHSQVPRDDDIKAHLNPIGFGNLETMRQGHVDHSVIVSIGRRSVEENDWRVWTVNDRGQRGHVGLSFRPMQLGRSGSNLTALNYVTGSSASQNTSREDVA